MFVCMYECMCMHVRLYACTYMDMYICDIQTYVLTRIHIEISIKIFSILAYPTLISISPRLIVDLAGSTGV